MARQTRVDMDEVFAGLNLLASSKESIARSMGVAMGQAVRDEAIVRAPVLKPGNEGTDGQTPGLLRDAMYVAYDKRRNVLNPNAYRYTVSWNAAKAPHGHLEEFGHWMPYEYAFTFGGLYYTPLVDKPKRGKAKGVPLQGQGIWVEAHPFLGPAFDAKLSTLLDIAQTAGAAKLAEVMKP